MNIDAALASERESLASPEKQPEQISSIATRKQRNKFNQDDQQIEEFEPDRDIEFN